MGATSFTKIGNELADEWGPGGDATAGEHLKAMFAVQDFTRLQLSLMAAQLEECRQMRALLGRLPSDIAKHSHSEEKLLEREKQKTAKAQQKANEAMPPVVTVVQMSNEEIEAAVNNGRVYRRF